MVLPRRKIVKSKNVARKSTAKPPLAGGRDITRKNRVKMSECTGESSTREKMQLNGQITDHLLPNGSFEVNSKQCKRSLESVDESKSKMARLQLDVADSLETDDSCENDTGLEKDACNVKGVTDSTPDSDVAPDCDGDNTSSTKNKSTNHDMTQSNTEESFKTSERDSSNSAETQVVTALPDSSINSIAVPHVNNLANNEQRNIFTVGIDLKESFQANQDNTASTSSSKHRVVESSIPPAITTCFSRSNIDKGNLFEKLSDLSPMRPSRNSPSEGNTNSASGKELSPDVISGNSVTKHGDSILGTADEDEDFQDIDDSILDQEDCEKLNLGYVKNNKSPKRIGKMLNISSADDSRKSGEKPSGLLLSDDRINASTVSAAMLKLRDSMGNGLGKSVFMDIKTNKDCVLDEVLKIEEPSTPIPQVRVKENDIKIPGHYTKEKEVSDVSTSVQGSTNKHSDSSHPEEKNQNKNIIPQSDDCKSNTIGSEVQVFDKKYVKNTVLATSADDTCDGTIDIADVSCDKLQVVISADDRCKSDVDISDLKHELSGEVPCDSSDIDCKSQPNATEDRDMGLSNIDVTDTDNMESGILVATHNELSQSECCETDVTKQDIIKIDDTKACVVEIPEAIDPDSISFAEKSNVSTCDHVGVDDINPMSEESQFTCPMEYSDGKGGDQTTVPEQAVDQSVELVKESETTDQSDVFDEIAECDGSVQETVPGDFEVSETRDEKALSDKSQIPDNMEFSEKTDVVHPLNKDDGIITNCHDVNEVTLSNHEDISNVTNNVCETSELSDKNDKVCVNKGSTECDDISPTKINTEVEIINSKLTVSENTDSSDSIIKETIAETNTNIEEDPTCDIYHNSEMLSLPNKPVLLNAEIDCVNSSVNTAPETVVDEPELSGNIKQEGNVSTKLPIKKENAINDHNLRNDTKLSEDKCEVKQEETTLEEEVKVEETPRHEQCIMKVEKKTEEIINEQNDKINVMTDEETDSASDVGKDEQLINVDMEESSKVEILTQDLNVDMISHDKKEVVDLIDGSTSAQMNNSAEVKKCKKDISRNKKRMPSSSPQGVDGAVKRSRLDEVIGRLGSQNNKKTGLSSFLNTKSTVTESSPASSVTPKLYEDNKIITLTGKELETLICKRVKACLQNSHGAFLMEFKQRIHALQSSVERWKAEAKELQKQVIASTAIQKRDRRRSTASCKVTTRHFACQVNEIKIQAANTPGLVKSHKASQKQSQSGGATVSSTNTSGTHSGNQTQHIKNVTLLNPSTAASNASTLPAGLPSSLPVGQYKLVSQLPTAQTQTISQTSAGTTTPAVVSGARAQTQTVRELLDHQRSPGQTVAVAGATTVLMKGVIDLTDDDMQDGNKKQSGGSPRRQVTLVQTSPATGTQSTSVAVRTPGPQGTQVVGTPSLQPGQTLLLQGPAVTSGTMVLQQVVTQPVRVQQLGNRPNSIMVPAGSQSVKSAVVSQPPQLQPVSSAVTRVTSTPSTQTTTRPPPLKAAPVVAERHTSSLRQSNQGTKNITPTPPPLIPTVEGGKRKDAEQLKDVKDPSRTNRKGLRHPAPLPAQPAYPKSGPLLKQVPPKPGLKISRVAQGIVLSWNMTVTDSNAEIVNYQLYAYQEGNAAPTSNLWKKVGDVKALPLPMACTLTQFQEGNKYHFAVRAVDVHGRLGTFSEPNTIHLLARKT